MKIQYILIPLLAFTAFWAQGQTNTVALYGFKQRSTGGMQKRGDLDETGKLIKHLPANVFHYAIYLANSSGTKVYPVQMWINGKAFSIKAKQVTATELIQKDVDREFKDLETGVAEAKSIWRLIPVPLAADKSNKQAKSFTIDNDVVVLYKAGGKLRYVVLKKFAELAPSVLQ